VSLLTIQCIQDWPQVIKYMVRSVHSKFCRTLKPGFKIFKSFQIQVLRELWRLYIYIHSKHMVNKARISKQKKIIYIDELKQRFEIKPFKHPHIRSSVAATRFWSCILQQHRYLRLTGGLKWKNAATTANNESVAHHQMY
jgi:hypothetical protein